MRVKYIRQSPRQGYTSVWLFDEGCESVKYTVPTGAVAELSVGLSLSEEEIDRLALLDGRRRALDRAASLLSASDKSRRTLLLRLTRSGFSRQVAEEAVEECVRLGYLDEERQLRRLVMREAQTQLRGPKYIMKKMLSAGYRGSDVSRVLRELSDSGELDFSEIFERLALRRSVTDPEERRALAYKYGFK